MLGLHAAVAPQMQGPGPVIGQGNEHFGEGAMGHQGLKQGVQQFVPAGTPYHRPVGGAQHFVEVLQALNTLSSLHAQDGVCQTIGRVLNEAVFFGEQLHALAFDDVWVPDPHGCHLAAGQRHGHFGEVGRSRIRPTCSEVAPVTLYARLGVVGLVEGRWQQVHRPCQQFSHCEARLFGQL